MSKGIDLCDDYRRVTLPNRSLTPADEVFRAGLRLRRAISLGLADKLFERLHSDCATDLYELRGGKDKVIAAFKSNLLTMLAHDDAFRKRLGVLGNPDSKLFGETFLLALARFEKYPPEYEGDMAQMMRRALEKREHKFFLRLGEQLRRKKATLRSFDDNVELVATLYWNKPYRYEDSSGRAVEIPPLRQLNDGSRCAMLRRLTGRPDLSPFGVRSKIQRLGLPPVGSNGKQRRGLNVDSRQLRHVKKLS